MDAAKDRHGTHKLAIDSVREQAAFAATVCRRYEAETFYHYTWPSHLMELLDSRSLLSCPTHQFKDKAEYVHGLGLILKRLKAIHAGDHNGVDEAWLRLFNSQVGGLRGFIQRVIELIGYEFCNPCSPNIEVFVACVSQGPRSEEMMQSYGNAVISFNRLLPYFAYETPDPFYASMLSRVTYEERYFNSFIMGQGLKLEKDVNGVTKFLAQFPPNKRRDVLAIAIAEHLCLIAPNIKRSQFQCEREWRLKSIRSKYPDYGLLRAFSAEYPAKFSDEFDPPRYKFNPPRYLHRLGLSGKFISSDVQIVGEENSSLASEVKEWRRVNEMSADEERTMLAGFEAMATGAVADSRISSAAADLVKEDPHLAVWLNELLEPGRKH